MPLVSGFALRFFEFSIAVADADRSRVGPETNVYTGTARARTCERTVITMIDGRPCVLRSASAVLRLERLELDVSFSGHCARRKKRPGKLPRRGSQQMTSHPLDYLNDSRAWEIILVTT
ncbi:unnamed protein product, partial [Heterotrigona itama]